MGIRCDFLKSTLKKTYLTPVFSKTVSFSAVSKLPDINFFKIIIEGIKFLVPSATEKFSVVPTNFMDVLWNNKLNES